MRTAWIQQTCLTFFLDDPPEGLVRYAPEDAFRTGGDVENLLLPTFECQWQEVFRSDGQVHYRSGPGAASLSEALEWAAASGCDRVMMGAGEEMFTTGVSPEPDVPALPASTGHLPGLDPSRPVVLGPASNWRAHYRVQLEPDDFDRAQPGFARALETDPEIGRVISAVDDPRLGTLDATFVIAAPLKSLARIRASAAGVRAATNHEEGVVDYTNGALNLFELRPE